ncbi:MAG: hypothetical protein Q9220_001031 [cf. Caloplaca sp. 1 TL-2023]
MDLTPPGSSAMGPPHSSPEMEHTGGHTNGMYGEASHGHAGLAANGLSAAAAASSQQPKTILQAYQYLLFLSDVFHTGSPDSALWEFKHGNGNFRRGDLAGLREIKRRASRHALIHRDSFSTTHKPSVSQPGTPAEPVPELSSDARLANLEHSLYEMHTRLVRTEESNTALSAKCQALSEGVSKCHQQDIARQIEIMRHLEDPHESLLSGRQPHFSNMALDAPLSPRQGMNEERRPSLQNIPPRANVFRPPVPPHFTTSPRRYGSIGTANPPLANYHRPIQAQPQIHHQPPQHPLACVSSPPGVNLGRRHTSADIRVPGWPPHQGSASPTASGGSPAHWPSSPHQNPSTSDQNLRDSLASYEFGAPRKSISSQQATPPLTSDTTQSAFANEGGWSFGPSKFASKYLDSAPQTRRSSMASNVHSLLNPAETAERDEEEPLEPDDRKRKRMQ